MPEDTAKIAAEKKAFELSYILIRVAERIRQKHLREKVESYAISLLENAAIGNKAGVAESVNVLEYLLRIGSEMGEVHEESVAVLTAELQKVITSIAGLSLLPVPIEFGSNTAKRREVRPRTARPQNESRQEEILQIIKQKGTCRFRDIQENLPDVSERTIRYDLGKMTEDGVIERVGAGGPDTFYRVREKVMQSVDNPQNQM